jgi:hypothetical protein
MPSHRMFRTIAVLILCVTGTVQAQTADYPGKEQLVPGTKTTLTYKYPFELKTYECCTPSDPQVLAPDTVDKNPGTSPITRFSGKGAVASANRMVSTCTDLSTLTPIEKFRRATSVFEGTCNQFSIWEHVMCTCENFCNDPNSFSCNCPGLPAGQLPEIKPQDSIGSQPELIAETFTSCGGP